VVYIRGTDVEYICFVFKSTAVCFSVDTESLSV
jgi:hypothetical protein